MSTKAEDSVEASNTYVLREEEGETWQNLDRYFRTEMEFNFKYEFVLDQVRLPIPHDDTLVPHPLHSPEDCTFYHLKGWEVNTLLSVGRFPPSDTTLKAWKITYKKPNEATLTSDLHKDYEPTYGFTFDQALADYAREWDLKVEESTWAMVKQRIEARIGMKYGEMQLIQVFNGVPADGFMCTYTTLGLLKGLRAKYELWDMRPDKAWPGLPPNPEYHTES